MTEAVGSDGKDADEPPRLPIELVEEIAGWVIRGHRSDAHAGGSGVSAMRLVSRAVKQMMGPVESMLAGDIFSRVLDHAPDPTAITAALGGGTLLQGITELSVFSNHREKADFAELVHAPMDSLNTALSLCTNLKSLRIWETIPYSRLRLGSGLARLQDVSVPVLTDPAAVRALDLRFLPSLLEVSLKGVDTDGELPDADPANFSILLGLPVYLASLTLRELNLDHHGARALRLCDRPDLVHLDLSDNPLNAVGVALLDIGSNTTLKRLHLQRTQLSDDGVAALGFAHNSTLTHLDLSYNTITSKGVRCLGVERNTTLESLQLRWNKIRDPTCLALTTNSSIHTLDLSVNPITNLDLRLNGNTSLIHLEVDVAGVFKNWGVRGDRKSRTTITRAQVARFSQALAAHQRLEELHVGFDTRDGDEWLLKALSLKGISSLRRLHLSETKVFGPAAFDTLGLAWLPRLEAVTLRCGGNLRDRRHHEELASRIRRERPDVRVSVLYWI